MTSARSAGLLLMNINNQTYIIVYTRSVENSSVSNHEPDPPTYEAADDSEAFAHREIRAGKRTRIEFRATQGLILFGLSLAASVHLRERVWAAFDIAVIVSLALFTACILAALCSERLAAYLAPRR